MKLFIFREPNFRCRVSKEGENGKKNWRLCYAEDKAQAKAFLESRDLVVHDVQPYDFKNEWLKSAQEETGKAAAAREAGQSWDFEPLWSVLKEHLFDLSGGKCVYCEAVCKHVGYGDVEHYRPKAGVAEDEDHPGYYWLAYDPENYLPSCQICNQYLKRSHFPIAETGVRACKPGDSLQDEQALLLNASSDDYEKHLEYIPSDQIENPGYATGTSDQGKTTIDIMKLNRDALIQLRRQEQCNARAALKLAQIEAHTKESPEPISRFLSRIRSGERQFLSAVICEIKQYHAKLGLPSPFQ